MVLGIATALKLDANDSRKTAWGAAVGTLGGFVIAVLMLLVIGDNKVALIALLPVVAFLATWFPAGRFALPLKQAGFSVWFIMLVSLAHGSLSMQIDETRIVDVGIGLLTSLVVTALMWPNGVATRVRTVLNESVRATAEYFTAAFTYIGSPMTDTDAAVLHRAVAHATTVRTQAQDAFDVALSQGGEPGRIASAWTAVSSSSDHVYFAAATVKSFPDYGLAPFPDAQIAALLTEQAQKLAQQYVRAVQTEYARAQTDPSSAPRQRTDETSSPAPIDADSLTDTAQAVHTAVEHLESSAHDVQGERGGRHFSMSRGHAAISMLWGLQWLRYFHHMATQTVADIATDGHAQRQHSKLDK